MATVPQCPKGSAADAFPLNQTIPLDSRLCWTQDLPCITDCCAALNGTMEVSCSLDQCLGSFAQLDWRDCVKDWYLDNKIDLEDKWYSCYPRAGASTSGTGAVSLDLSGAPSAAGRPSRRSLLITLIVMAAVLAV